MVDQQLKNLRNGLKIGVSQPLVIFKGYESTYDDHIVENYDPKKIHEYYQKLKLESSKKIESNKVKPQWQVKGKLIKSTDHVVVKIGKFKGNKCYAMLSDKILKNKIVTESYNKLRSSMEDGFTKNMYNSNGIKFLQNKNVFELKWKKDSRPYTNTVYIDFITKYWLIVFDHLTNHKGIGSLPNFNEINKVTTNEVSALGNDSDNVTDFYT